MTINRWNWERHGVKVIRNIILAALKNPQGTYVKYLAYNPGGQPIDKVSYVKVYKPLMINKKVCLKCHGDITNEKLKNTIAKKYPEDKATGYKMGDIRGAVVVTIKK